MKKISALASFAILACSSGATAAPQKAKPFNPAAVRVWACDGAAGRFTMRLANVQVFQWGIYGNVAYSPENPFDYVEGSDGFSYVKKKQIFNIGENPETGEEGINFYIEGRSMIANVGAGANFIQCRPAN